MAKFPPGGGGGIPPRLGTTGLGHAGQFAVREAERKFVLQEMGDTLKDTGVECVI